MSLKTISMLVVSNFYSDAIDSVFRSKYNQSSISIGILGLCFCCYCFERRGLFKRCLLVYLLGIFKGIIKLMFNTEKHYWFVAPYDKELISYGLMCSYCPPPLIQELCKVIYFFRERFKMYFQSRTWPDVHIYIFVCFLLEKPWQNSKISLRLYLRCLVHILRETTVKYSKIRSFHGQCQLDLCRHEVRYGCLREDECFYAHSLVELKVWILQNETGRFVRGETSSHKSRNRLLTPETTLVPRGWAGGWMEKGTGMKECAFGELRGMEWGTHWMVCQEITEPCKQIWNWEKKTNLNETQRSLQKQAGFGRALSQTFLCHCDGVTSLLILSLAVNCHRSFLEWLILSAAPCGDLLGPVHSCSLLLWGTAIPPTASGAAFVNTDL